VHHRRQRRHSAWISFLAAEGLLYRLARGKPISSVYEAEFTSLHLRD